MSYPLFIYIFFGLGPAALAKQFSCPCPVVALFAPFIFHNFATYLKPLLLGVNWNFPEHTQKGAVTGHASINWHGPALGRNS